MRRAEPRLLAPRVSRDAAVRSRNLGIGARAPPPDPIRLGRAGGEPPRYFRESLQGADRAAPGPPRPPALACAALHDFTAPPRGGSSDVCAARSVLCSQVSRDDYHDVSREHKKLDKLFPIDAHWALAIILDDNAETWSNAGEPGARARNPSENLVHVDKCLPPPALLLPPPPPRPESCQRNPS